MDRQMIKDYSIGDKATLVLRFSDVQIRKTTANQDYASLIGFDGKDLIEVKIWSLPQDKKDSLKNGEVYEATGTMKDYQGKMQFNVSDFKQVDEGEYDLSEFYEYAKISSQDLQKEIIGYTNKIENNIIKEIVVKLLKENYRDYFLHPAAITMHHNYFSGLAYHVYSMLVLSEVYLKQYPFLNKDLVYAGIIIHDIGKVVELSGGKGAQYTKIGNLLGHISIGANMVYKTACDLGYEETDEAISLMHIILSHHGVNEYGSPKEPLIAEAVLIYLLDFSDSRMAALEKEYKNVDELKGGYTNSLPAFDRKMFYVPNIGKDNE